MVMEKPLDDLKGNILKLQLVFMGDMPEELNEKINILHITKTGSVYTAIVRGNAVETDRIVKEYTPLVYDKVSLTLEEVFIYELGGLGYDFKEITL